MKIFWAIFLSLVLLLQPAFGQLGAVLSASSSSAPPPSLSISSTAWQGASSSATFSFSVAPSAGNLLVVFIGQYTGTGTGTITDNIDTLGTTWTQVGASSGTLIGQIWYKKNLPSGVTTLNIVAGGPFPFAIAQELIGCSTTAPLGGSFFPSSNSTGSPATVGPLTNAATNAIYIAGITCDTGTTTPVGPWALADATNSTKPAGPTESGSVPYLIVSSGGAQTASWTTSGQLYSGGIAYFVP